MDLTEKQLESEEIYRGKIITVYRDTVSLPEGRTSKREIVEHAGGAGVVALDEDGYIYLVRQYRYAFGCELLEIPAGKLECGEDPLKCAVRELSEETGFTAEKIEFLGEIQPSPGYCREVLYDYLATGLKSGNMHLDPGEYLKVERLRLEDAYRAVMHGELADAKTVIGILKTWERFRSGT